jgi:hypothetical protein
MANFRRERQAIFFENRGIAWKSRKNKIAKRKLDHAERSSARDADRPTYFLLVACRSCGRYGNAEIAGTTARS